MKTFANIIPRTIPNIISYITNNQPSSVASGFIKKIKLRTLKGLPLHRY